MTNNFSGGDPAGHACSSHVPGRNRLASTVLPVPDRHQRRMAAPDYAVAVRTGPMLPLRLPPPSPGTPLASIVVPTHNDGLNIGLLLARLLDDEHVGDIVVVASECGDDTVPTVLEAAGRSGGRVRLYVEAERSGKAAAVNFGLGETTLPYIIIISGDVLPEPGAIGHLLQALQAPGIGMAGGRPRPINPDSSPIGHAVQLMWRLHHRLALHQPKLGEMIALRAEATVALPRTSVDEACFQAMLEAGPWRSAYVPEAVVVNQGPCTFRDFVKQRRQVHAGHLWLRRHQHYTVPSLHPGLLALEMVHDLVADVRRLAPRRLAWTAAAIAMEVGARLLARSDYLRGRENHVWNMVQSTKAPGLDAHGVLAGDGQLVESDGPAPAPAHQRDRQHQLPMQLPLSDVQRLRPEGEGARG